MVAVSFPDPTATTIGTEERDFLVAIGERVATLPRAGNLTHVQLAEVLGVSQQTLSSCEVGRSRIPVSALPVVAGMPAVSLDGVFGSKARAARGKRGPASRLAQPIGVLAPWPKAKQRFVSKMIKTVIAQAAR